VRNAIRRLPLQMNDHPISRATLNAQLSHTQVTFANWWHTEGETLCIFN
jgi:hypothetical protein